MQVESVPSSRTHRERVCATKKSRRYPSLSESRKTFAYAIFFAYVNSCMTVVIDYKQSDKGASLHILFPTSGLSNLKLIG